MEKGVILFGEAAQSYITYKYVELFVAVGLLVVILSIVGYIFYKTCRH